MYYGIRFIQYKQFYIVKFLARCFSFYSYFYRISIEKKQKQFKRFIPFVRILSMMMMIIITIERTATKTACNIHIQFLFRKKFCRFIILRVHVVFETRRKRRFALRFHYCLGSFVPFFLRYALDPSSRFRRVVPIRIK